MPRCRWTYETCYEEAKKYKSRTELQKGTPGAYGAALHNGWLKDYTWLVKPEPHNKKWTYETCLEEAKKYTCSSEFQKGNGSAYSVARASGWIADYEWFQRKVHEVWTYEACMKEAKKYKTRLEFAHGNNGAYSAALNHGWMNDCTWFEQIIKPARYWNYEKCLEESKQYSSRGEFAAGSPTAYGKSRKHNWLDDFVWLKDERLDFVDGNIDCVYAYFFEEEHTVYVGRTLTKRKTQRDVEHIFRNDAVSAYAKEHGIPVPPMTILEDHLKLKDGVAKEGYWVEYYREQGWTILNKAKTGGLGLIAKGKWTYETCYREARKYSRRCDFAKSPTSCSAYDVARRNGWLDDYSWFEELTHPAGYWTYDTCLEEAKKYKLLTDFSRNASRAYVIAKKNGWLADYTWFRKERRAWNKKWYYDNCFEEAKKYDTAAQLRKGCSSAYTVSQKNGWIKEYTWFKDPKKALSDYFESIRKWTYESCLEEAKKYTSRKEFSDFCSGAYNVARKHGWLGDYTWFKPPNEINRKWNKKTCYEAALKYTSRNEFSKKSSGAYFVALKNGWLDDYTWLVVRRKPSGFWTYERCKEESSKYGSRWAFGQGNASAYYKCVKEHWLDDFFPLKQDSDTQLEIKWED